MRVGFDARWYNQSGVGSYIAGLLPALVRAGCELVVYVDPSNPVPGLDKLSVQTVPVSSGKYSLLATLEFRRSRKARQARPLSLSLLCSSAAELSGGRNHS